MQIVERNFFRLLRAGTFGTEEEIEPMSAWKWKQVLAWAQEQEMVPLLSRGIDACSSQFFMRLTEKQRQKWQQLKVEAEQRQETTCSEMAELLSVLGQLQFRPVLLDPWPTAVLYDSPACHRQCTVSIYFPYETQGRKADEWAQANGTLLSPLTSQPSTLTTLHYSWNHLQVEHRHSLFVLNKRSLNKELQRILEQEWLEGGMAHVVICGQRIETVSPTLYMLVCLLSIAKTMLNQGPALWQMVDMGMLLQHQADRVDFAKLVEWIGRLYLSRMSQLVGATLTELLGFTPGEVPFAKVESGKWKAGDLAHSLIHDSRHGGSSKYLRYYPGEGLSSMVTAITRTLEKVEE